MTNTASLGLLDGGRVIDLGQGLAGPAAAMMFADSGAEVDRIALSGGSFWNPRREALAVAPALRSAAMASQEPAPPAPDARGCRVGRNWGLARGDKLEETGLTTQATISAAHGCCAVERGGASSPPNSSHFQGSSLVSNGGSPSWPQT
jgi:hypothetical protein